VCISSESALSVGSTKMFADIFSFCSALKVSIYFLLLVTVDDAKYKRSEIDILKIIYKCKNDNEPGPLNNIQNCSLSTHGTSSFIYDNQGEVIRIEGEYGGLAITSNLTYETNKITSTTSFPLIPDYVITYTRIFENNQLVKIEMHEDGDFIDVINFYYNTDGKLKSVVLKNDSVVHYYNSKKTNIVKTDHFNSKTKTHSTTYTHDNNKNPLHEKLNTM
jgi:hypothetical protein